MTTTIHSTTVVLPAHAFSSHKLQRMFLTRRSATALRLTPIQEMRRTRSVPSAKRLDLETAPAPRRQWVAAACSITLMVAMVVLSCWATGIIHLAR